MLQHHLELVIGLLILPADVVTPVNRVFRTQLRPCVRLSSRHLQLAMDSILSSHIAPKSSMADKNLADHCEPSILLVCLVCNRPAGRAEMVYNRPGLAREEQSIHQCRVLARADKHHHGFIHATRCHPSAGVLGCRRTLRESGKTTSMVGRKQTHMAGAETRADRPLGIR